MRDVTIQWKSMGAIVGTWNQLVYGIAFYVMEKISGDAKISRSPLTFFFYFLGLTNLLFNWGHHTYIVPAAPYVRMVSYIISMTELLILGNIIYNWRRTVSNGRKNFYSAPYRLMLASDFWIFLNLALAIAISVPAVNVFTHGTHITVAHAMGATIGINTMILLSALYYLAEIRKFKPNRKNLATGFWLLNISLLVFWLSLLGAGISKAYALNEHSSFSLIMKRLYPGFMPLHFQVWAWRLVLC